MGEDPAGESEPRRYIDGLNQVSPARALPRERRLAQMSVPTPARPFDSRLLA
jgi:hypothetical protein